MKAAKKKLEKERLQLRNKNIQELLVKHREEFIQKISSSEEVSLESKLHETFTNLTKISKNKDGKAERKGLIVIAHELATISFETGNQEIFYKAARESYLGEYLIDLLFTSTLKKHDRSNCDLEIIGLLCFYTEKAVNEDYTIIYNSAVVDKITNFLKIEYDHILYEGYCILISNIILANPEIGDNNGELTKLFVLTLKKFVKDKYSVDEDIIVLIISFYWELGESLLEINRISSLPCKPSELFIICNELIPLASGPDLQRSTCILASLLSEDCFKEGVEKANINNLETLAIEIINKEETERKCWKYAVSLVAKIYQSLGATQVNLLKVGKSGIIRILQTLSENSKLECVMNTYFIIKNEDLTSSDEDLGWQIIKHLSSIQNKWSSLIYQYIEENTGLKVPNNI